MSDECRLEGPISMSDKLRVLLLADYRPDQAGTLIEHIESFGKYSKHEIHLLNPCGVGFKTWMDFNCFDALIIHYSLCVIYDHFIPEDIEKKIRRFKGLKVQFIQDDYRWVDRIVRKIDKLGIHLLYSLVGEEERAKVWGPLIDKGVTVKTTLTGYVPESLVNYNTLPIKERHLHVGYRGRDLPYWLGALSQEKIIIGRKFKEVASKYSITYDISWHEDDRIYGDAWIEFVASSKAQLGAESGSSITDYNGEVEHKVNSYLAEHPDAEFADVARNVLEPFEGNVMMNVISPRVFEAIVLKTALVMFPGEYSKILLPERHYILLNKDFSNIEEVIALLKDDDYLQRLVDRAFDEIVADGKYSYQTFISGIDADLLHEIESRGIERNCNSAGLKLGFGKSRYLASVAASSLISKVSRLKHSFAMLKARLANHQYGRRLVPLYRTLRKVSRHIVGVVVRIGRTPLRAFLFIRVFVNSAALFKKEKCIRAAWRLFGSEYAFKQPIVGIHLLSQITRLVTLRYHYVNTMNGVEKCQLRLIDDGDGCFVIKLSVAGGLLEEEDLALNREQYINLVGRCRQVRLYWRKSMEIISGPILLPDPEGEFPLIGRIAGLYPALVADAIFGE